MKTTATISSKGHVVLPRAVRERLGVKQGDGIGFILNDTGIHVRLEAREPNPFLAWIGTAPTGDTAAAQWLEEVRHAGLDERDLALLRRGPGAHVVRFALGAPHEPQTDDRP